MHEIASMQVDALYADHHGWLYSWLRRKLGDTYHAADLAHDTFVRVMVSRRLPSTLGVQPRALLTHIAKGLMIDHWRRQEVERAFLEVLALMPEAQAPSAEAHLLVLEALWRADAMLNRLPSRTREIFLLVQLDGLSYQQVADQLDTALITVKRHMRTAYAACLALA